MIGKLEGKNTLVGLLALYFALGYLVGRSADKPGPLDAASAQPPPESAPAVVAAPTPGPVVVAAAQPAPQPAPAPVAQPAAQRAPTPSPSPAPAPVAAQPTPPPPRPAVAASPPPAAKPAPPAARKSDQIWKVTVREADASIGPKDAPMTAVFFSAFACPTCRAFKEGPKKLVEKYGDKVRIVWKHKVVPPPHPDAMDASLAAIAAQKQGKFWEFHDKIFETNATGLLDLEEHAKAVGLDIARFRKDQREPETRKQALQDALLANMVGAHSMPNVLINGIRMSGPKTLDNMMATAERVIGTVGKPYDEIVAAGKAFPQLGPQVPTRFQTDHSPSVGPKDAKVQLVVFEDFQ